MSFIGRFIQRKSERAKEMALAPSIRETVSRGLWGRLLRPARRDRKTEAKLGESFERLLQFWGITPQQLGQVKKSLRIELWTFTAMAVGIVLLSLWILAGDGSILYGIVGLIWAASMATVALTKAWRLSVLIHQRFSPFTAWLLGRRR